MHERASVSRLLEIAYEVDALVAMAETTRDHDFILPEIATGAPHVRAHQVVHPCVENAVANDVLLYEEHNVLFLE